MKEEYLNKGQIGEGGCSKVFLVEDSEGQLVAMKEYEKRNLKDEYLLGLLENEVQVLRLLQPSPNPHLVRLHKVLNSPHHLYLVLEYCN